jgi:hypothetical protein
MTHPDEPDSPRVLRRIEEGDLLWIRPPLGDAYTCRVREVDRDDETVTIRREVCDAYGGVTRRETTLSARELAELAVNGGLVVNPERPARGGHPARGDRVQ